MKKTALQLKAEAALKAKKYDTNIKAGKEAMAKKDYAAAITAFTEASKFDDKEKAEAAKVLLQEAETAKAGKPAEKKDKSSNPFQKLLDFIHGGAKFVSAVLADGTEISYEGELAQGTVVTMVVQNPETNEDETVPVPEGEYALTGDMEGKSIVVGTDENGQEGVVLELKDTVANSEEQNSKDNPALKQLADLITEGLGNITKELQAHKKESDSRFQTIVEGFSTGKIDKSKFTRKGDEKHNEKDEKKKGYGFAQHTKPLA